MTTAQSLITIGIIALGTVFTRFLPFWLFPKGKPAPRIVAYLGKVLPCAVMGLLVVYCLKDVQPAAAPSGLPELIAVAATAGLLVGTKNTLLSLCLFESCGTNAALHQKCFPSQSKRRFNSACAFRAAEKRRRAVEACI